MSAKPIYCYETKQIFSSISSAARAVSVSKTSLSPTINRPDRTSGGYHWCTDLSIFDGVKLSSRVTPVYCYETGKGFNSLQEATDFLGLSDSSSIQKAFDQPNKTAGGYHWCSDLSIFEGASISYHDNRKKIVYCYETKQKFDSILSAGKFIGSRVHEILNLPDRTAGGYHWCTDLSVFDGVELSYGKGKPIYCYETKQKFYSIASAAKFSGVFEGVISHVLDNPNRTAGGYHWCTSLSVFDEIELLFGLGKKIFCYETKQQFKSIAEASKFVNINKSSLGVSVDKHNKTSAGYHWCSDLSIFDGVDLIYPEQGISVKEGKVLDFIKSIYRDTIIDNSREIISPKELDIYIPDKSLAIEFNGDYWHSEEYKPRNYHIDKTNLCKDKGIQLIHIFEHQWESKSEIFKSVISNKLGLSNKIYARKCKIVELDSTTDFLNTNHLQGNCSSSVKLGLTYNDELVSVMTFGKPRFNKSYEFELLRFCNKLNTTVVGGASKLLNYFEKNYKPSSIISYANLQWSNGNVYKNLGFTELSISEPNYWWTKNREVLTRYQCQKHKLKDLLKDKFNQNLSEKENMKKAGYSRLFDCGNMVYIK